MTAEPKHKQFGTPMREWVEQVANELPYDAVGMWQIVPGGRYGFQLEGDALTKYARRCLAELLSRGAVPVIGGGGTEHEWIVQRQHGTRPGEIIDNVVREWLANGAPNEDPGGLWFALPEHAWAPP